MKSLLVIVTVCSLAIAVNTMKNEPEIIVPGFQLRQLPSVTEAPAIEITTEPPSLSEERCHNA